MDEIHLWNPESSVGMGFPIWVFDMWWVKTPNGHTFRAHAFHRYYWFTL